MRKEKLYCEICNKSFPVDVSITVLVDHLSHHRKGTLLEFIIGRCLSETFKKSVLNSSEKKETIP